MRGAGVSRIVVVTAPAAQDVRDFAAREGAESVIQSEQLGTGHAAACAACVLGEFPGVLVVAYGDMPLVTPDTFERSFAARENAGMAIVAFRSPSHAYGRVIVDRDGKLARIVEYKDANADERKIDLCNAGILAAQMIGLSDPGIAKKLEAHKEKLARGVEEKSRKLREK